MGGTLNSVNANLQKNLKYYRLTLYIYSLSSLLEMMLIENFKEDYVNAIKEKINKYAIEYREVFTSCSEYLEELARHSVGKTVLQGVGMAENALGNLIGNIPKIKEGQVDEWLIKAGSQLKERASGIEKDVVDKFAVVGDPGTSIFVERLEEISKIYNHTADICFDEKNIYLLVG